MRPIVVYNIWDPGGYMRRMYAIVHPTVTVLCPADAISNALRPYPPPSSLMEVFHQIIKKKKIVLNGKPFNPIPPLNGTAIKKRTSFFRLPFNWFFVELRKCWATGTGISTPPAIMETRKRWLSWTFTRKKSQNYSETNVRLLSSKL